ncbi:unnamed protein product, partial [Rotaria magnacalcarata]
MRIALVTDAICDACWNTVDGSNSPKSTKTGACAANLP